MSQEVLKFIEICQWDSARFFIFSENVFAPLIYYSHLLPLVVSLLLAFFVFHNSRSLAAKWLLATTIFLSFWLFSDLVLWAHENPSYIMFFWSLLVLIEPMIYIGMLFFSYALINNKDISFKGKLLIFILLLPIIVLAPTNFALLYFDLSNCEREAIEGQLASYGYIIEIIFSIWILGFGIRKLIQTKIFEEKKKIALIIFGIVFFLLSFSSGNIIGSLSLDWTIGQYGLFGIPVFVALLAYLITRYKVFDIKVVGTQILVASLWVALLSVLFVRTIENVRIIVILTLVVFTGVGFALVRSVRKEVIQREYLQGGAEELYKRNAEIAMRNKMLALLEKLYRTSVLTLTPGEAGQKAANVIRKDLALEFLGIMALDEKTDALAPLVFSGSERLLKLTDKIGFFPGNISVQEVSKNNFLSKFNHRSVNITDNLADVWSRLINPNSLREMEKGANIRNIISYPLNIGDKRRGVMILGLNRSYDTFNDFEKKAMVNITDVVSLLLQKAYLYEGLQVAYEAEKRAHIIERKAKEELEKLDKVKDQFFMITQHNLRTPLTAIMGYSELLLDGDFGKLNKKTAEVIKKFQVLARRIKRMADDFLDVAKFQLGREVVSLKPDVKMPPLLEEIIDEVKFAAESKGLYLKTEFSKDLPAISADPEKLKAALFNIIDNAVKYTEKGGIIVKIKNFTPTPKFGVGARTPKIKNSEGDRQILTSNSQLPNSIVIEVRDTGIGIPKDKVKDLFTTQFQRGEEAQKAFAGGHGIGLYLSGQIIKAHKGRVWAESEGEGKGSVFFVELPQ